MKPLEVHPKLLIVNAKPVRGDLEAAPVGIYDVIRSDVRELSTVQPVDRVFVERSDIGYRGVLYSHDRPFMFALNGSGFVAKPLEDNVSVLDLCTKFEESERALTEKFDAERADAEQSLVNVDFGSRVEVDNDVTAIVEDAPLETTRTWGPRGDDVMERVPGNYRQRVAARSKRHDGTCGGGVVVNKLGKLLLVKPTNGYGGYDWTFPKGYPSNDDLDNQVTAIREVEEETGVTCTLDRKIGRFTHNDGGVCDYYSMSPSTDKIAVDGEEVAEARWVTLVEALEMLNDDVDVRILAQANQLIPTMIIKGGASHQGVMIALHLPKSVAQKVALPNGEPPGELHITLAYLGKGLTDNQKKLAAKALRRFAGSVSGMTAVLGGVGRFSASESSEGRDVVYLSVDSPDITKLRPRLVAELAAAGIVPRSDHGFTPHVTLSYIAAGAKTPLERFEPISLRFDSIALSIAGRRIDMPFRKPLLIKAAVKRPGIRGGKWYRDDNGEVQYGTRPVVKPRTVKPASLVPSPSLGQPEPKRERVIAVSPAPAKTVKDNSVNWNNTVSAITNIPTSKQEVDTAQKSVRRFIRSIIGKYGVALPKAVNAGHDQIHVSDADTEDLGALAFHHWDGSVAISKSVHSEFTKFCEFMAGGDRSSAIDAETVESARVMVHEELHGCSAILPAAYVGVGVLVEEVATEVTARQIIRREFGEITQVGSDSVSKVKDGRERFVAGWSSYSTEIAAVSSCVSRVLETREDSGDITNIVPVMVEAACLALKSQKFSMVNTPLMHLNNFVACFHGLSVGEREILAGLLEDHCAQ